MRTDTEIKHDAMNILIKNLGILETERFIMLLNQQPLDYTEWRKNLPEYSSIEELSRDAMKYRKKMNDQNGE